MEAAKKEGIQEIQSLKQYQNFELSELVVIIFFAESGSMYIGERITHVVGMIAQRFIEVERNQ